MGARMRSPLRDRRTWPPRQVSHDGPGAAVILRHPTDRYPRFRLRVFDLCWPWRASLREVVADALASHNARRDRDDRCIYLDAAAMIQRDPPHRSDVIRHHQRRGDA